MDVIFEFIAFSPPDGQIRKMDREESLPIRRHFYGAPVALQQSRILRRSRWILSHIAFCLCKIGFCVRVYSNFGISSMSTITNKTSQSGTAFWVNSHFPGYLWFDMHSKIEK
jgi:hypothetical protein